MFIKEIELENFQNLKTGLGVDRLKIDFSRQKNPVCLIIGPNGSGKTSLLSYLTPFATVGNLDVRDSSRPVIKKKNGYKKIVLIDDEKNEYTIEHFYTPQNDTFSIKSYFKLNDVELNENGNVSTFKDLVSEYLDIEMNYLKLIRMGDNVKNLISSKSAERKVFAGKILESVDWYIKKHKEISQKEREVSAVIGHIVDEIKKTEVTDKKEAKREIDEIKKEIAEEEAEEESLKEKEARIRYDIENLHITDDLESKLEKAKKKVDSFDKILKTAESKSVEDTRKRITELEIEKTRLETEEVAITTELHSLMKSIEEFYDEDYKLKQQIEEEKTHLNIESLEEYLVTIRKKINLIYHTSYDERPVICTKDELEEFMVFIKNIQSLLNVTYEFGKAPIKKVLSGMRENKDIPNIITSSLIAIEAQENAERLSIIDRIINRYAGIKIDCKESCPLKNLQKELIEIKDAVPVTDIKYTAEFYQMMKLAYDNLRTIFDQLTLKKPLIDKMPDDVKSWFYTANLYKNIENTKPIYDEAVLNDYLSFVTEKEYYFSLVKERDDLEKEIASKKASSKLDFLVEREDVVSKHIKDYERQRAVLLTKLDEKTDEINRCRKSLDYSTELVEALTDYEKAVANLSDMTNRNELYKKYHLELVTVENQVGKMHTEIHYKKRNIDQREFRLKRYKYLIKALDEQRAIYDDYNYLKFALSGTTGIPLEYIRIYFEDVTKIANELLDIVYHGDLYLDEFTINESEFLMPYVKNGIRVEDVSSASQGEASFFNMAISSALRAMSMTKYNIGLYDEVDSMFDDTNRQGFIPVLEKQLELNNISQAFLITHNLMFRQYPVDIIDLGNLNNSTVNVEFE
jgi:DNA repair exonuclease SbcCD ATPase subunit